MGVQDSALSLDRLGSLPATGLLEFYNKAVEKYEHFANLNSSSTAKLAYTVTVLGIAMTGGKQPKKIHEYDFLPFPKRWKDSQEKQGVSAKAKAIAKSLLKAKVLTSKQITAISTLLD